ncbi:MAG: nucleotidyltransferase family protein [Gammaproteobacteria bacterium]
MNYLNGAKQTDKIKKIVMNKKEALKILNRLKPILVERYGVTRLALFGSTGLNYDATGIRTAR